jgi:hypothetical protein
MAQEGSSGGVGIARLILIPAVITLAITLLRLYGELHHWSPLFFNREAGGGLAIVGISWLPIFFGPYFASKLAGPASGYSAGKSIGFALLGFLVMAAGGILAFAKMNAFPGAHALGLLLLVAAAAIQFATWPKLAKVLVAYGYAARIPVAIVMFFAIRGNWGTHYDALAPGYAGPTTFWAKYTLIGLEPQLILWIAYTTIIGSLFAGIFMAFSRRKASTQAAS